jgi:hypothetical protein
MEKVCFVLLVCLFSLSCQAQRKEILPIITESNCKYYYNKQLKNNIYSNTDIPATYPCGGEAGFIRYINQNISLSKSEVDKLPFQRVFFMVIIGSDGDVISTIILDKEGETKEDNNLTLLEKDFVRIISESEKWIPAKCNNTNVTAQVVLHWSIPRLK